MLKAVLLDLDDTLLTNDMDVFAPVYLKALAATVADRVDPRAFVAAVMHGSAQMMAKTTPGDTLERFFARDFYPAIGLDQPTFEPVFRQFYTQRFGDFAYLTGHRPVARPLVDWLLSAGFRVVIATNPLFPRVAIEHRLRWAGLPVDELDFALVTSYEHMHFAKPQPAYYAEILARIGVRPDEALMVGNDWHQDIAPAHAAGLHTWWVATDGTWPPDPAVALAGVGSLDAFRAFACDDHCLATLGSRSVEPSRLLAGLNASVAVYDTLARNLTDNQWQVRAAPGEWNPSEILQHLVEAETAAHQPRIEAITSRQRPHLKPVDLTAIAEARPASAPARIAALDAFLAVRAETVARLSQLSDQDWMRVGHHAMFGPTTLCELMSIAIDHDHEHLRQLEATLGIAV